MFTSFNHDNFHQICDQLASADADLAQIINNYGYPPLWSRPNTFESLVHIILEQQVSLASALSALNKLKEAIQEITPGRLLLLTDEELKACYFSRQKTAYVRYLAEALLSGQINLEAFGHQSDNEVRTQLTALKGIGNWTVDVYLMFVLHRADIFPIGDLAAVQSMKKVKQLPAGISRDEMIFLAQRWQPYRTVATMLLWHDYLSRRKNSV
jgi:DNA-3-methyladenine glycosylase II